MHIHADALCFPFHKRPLGACGGVFLAPFCVLIHAWYHPADCQNFQSRRVFTEREWTSAGLVLLLEKKVKSWNGRAFLFMLVIKLGILFATDGLLAASLQPTPRGFPPRET